MYNYERKRCLAVYSCKASLREQGKKMLKIERLERIEKYVEKNKYATVRELSKILNTSSATIRRDIETLAAQKRILVTHGGVAANDRKVSAEAPYLEKSQNNMEEKARIAKEASKFVVPGSTVLIDAGTTTLNMVPYLREIPDLNLVTNDVFMAAELSNASGNVTVLGGALRHGYYSVIGYYAENMVSNMRVDMCVIGSDAVSLKNGLMISNLDEVGLKRSLIEASNKVIVVCDHTKFITESFVSVCGLDKVDVFVTGEEIDSDVLKELEKMGKNVRLAYKDNS